jgi:hypothetical protein
MKQIVCNASPLITLAKFWTAAAPADGRTHPALPAGAHLRSRRLITGPVESGPFDKLRTGSRTSPSENASMVMKPAVIPEGVFYHDHPQDAVIEAQSRLKRDAKEHQQALVGTVVKRELPPASSFPLDKIAVVCAIFEE